MNGNPPVPPAPQPKKGIPAVGWVGIGCGTILIIAIVVISLISFKGNGRTLNIVITGMPGEDAQVNVGYEEEK